MATEKTTIKDSKINGGIVGLTRKKSALIRWNITRHIMGHFSAAMKVRSGLVTTDRLSMSKRYIGVHLEWKQIDRMHFHALTS
jgi:hypothetical protein